MWKLTVWAGDPRDNLLAESPSLCFFGGVLFCGCKMFNGTYCIGDEPFILHLHVWCSWRDNTFLTLTSPFIIEKDGHEHCDEYFWGVWLRVCNSWYVHLLLLVFFFILFYRISWKDNDLLNGCPCCFSAFFLVPFFLGFLHLLFYFSWYSQHSSWVFSLLPFLWKNTQDVG